MIAAAFLVSLLWHPFHVSVGEAQWSADGTRMQISLRLHPRDLDAALSETMGRRVILEQESDEKAEAILTRYLADAIYLSASPDAAAAKDAAAVAARRKRFHWVGMENELRYVWVYFELERPDSAASLWLTNQVLFELEPTQINTLQLLKTDPPLAIRTTRAEPTQRLPKTG